MEFYEGLVVNNVEIIHSISVVQKDNKEYVVVSDGYYDVYVGFESCSYVDETALISKQCFMMRRAWKKSLRTNGII